MERKITGIRQCSEIFGKAQMMRSLKYRKTITNKRKPKRDTMHAEYRFDYRKAKPNRFAARMSAGIIAVVLDRDVAAVFQSSEVVNSLLRSVISAMPESKHGRAG